MESRKARLTDTEGRMVVAMCWGSWQWGAAHQTVPISLYEMSKFWGSHVQHGDSSSEYCKLEFAMRSTLNQTKSVMKDEVCSIRRVDTYGTLSLKSNIIDNHLFYLHLS